MTISRLSRHCCRSSRGPSTISRSSPPSPTPHRKGKVITEPSEAPESRVRWTQSFQRHIETVDLTRGFSRPIWSYAPIIDWSLNQCFVIRTISLSTVYAGRQVKCRQTYVDHERQENQPFESVVHWKSRPHHQPKDKWQKVE